MFRGPPLLLSGGNHVCSFSKYEDLLGASATLVMKETGVNKVGMVPDLVALKTRQ